MPQIRLIFQSNILGIMRFLDFFPEREYSPVHCPAWRGDEYDAL